MQLGLAFLEWLDRESGEFGNLFQRKMISQHIQRDFLLLFQLPLFFGFPINSGLFQATHALTSCCERGASHLCNKYKYSRRGGADWAGRTGEITIEIGATMP
jgi:hypothetical protein